MLRILTTASVVVLLASSSVRSANDIVVLDPALMKTDPLQYEEITTYDSRTGLQGGAALYLLKPVFENNPAYTFTSAPALPAGSQSTVEFLWNYAAAPKVWLGWEPDDEIGVRGSWFYFDQGSPSRSTSMNDTDSFNGVTILPSSSLPALSGGALYGVGAFAGAPSDLIVGVIDPGSGVDRLTFNSGLSLVYGDIEATAKYAFRRATLDVSGGARFIHIAQNYAMRVDSTATIGGVLATETQSLGYGHNFNGAGPTLALLLSRPIGNSDFSLFASARGSILLGWSRQSFSFSALLNDPTGTVTIPSPTSGVYNSTAYRTIPVAELELGGEYCRDIGDFRLLLRTGLVAQSYVGAGSASSANGNLLLFGLQIATGINC